VFDSLKDNYWCNLAGFCEPYYDLVGNYGRDVDGTLACDTLAPAHIKKMISNFTQLFDTIPKDYSSPLEEVDHAEPDLKSKLDQDGT
jgi:hypothetical protein